MGLQEFNAETKLTCAQIRDKQTLFYSKKKDNRKPVVWGVYFIRNIVNNKIYVGSSNDIVRRWRDHCWDLISRQHINSHLLSAWEKYGQDNFVFELKEIFQPKEELKRKENLKTLRQREQYYINLYDTSNNKKGYNESKKATNPCVDNCKKLLNREKKVSSDQFFKIIDLLLKTNLNLREIADEVGVKYSFVKDVYQKREYKDLLEKYNFPVRSNDKTEQLKAKHWDEILFLYNQGISAEEISRKIGCGVSGLKNLLRKEGLPCGVERPRFYVFDIYQNLICSGFSAVEVGCKINQNSGTIVAAANHKRLLGGKYKVSKTPNPPPFNELENMMGHYCSSSKREIIVVGYKNGIPEKICCGVRNNFSKENYEKLVYLLKTGKENEEEIRGYFWKRIENVPESDKQILINKNLKG